MSKYYGLKVNGKPVRCYVNAWSESCWVEKEYELTLLDYNEGGIWLVEDREIALKVSKQDPNVGGGSFKTPTHPFVGVEIEVFEVEI